MLSSEKNEGVLKRRLQLPSGEETLQSAVTGQCSGSTRAARTCTTIQWGDKVTIRRRHSCPNISLQIKGSLVQKQNVFFSPLKIKRSNLSKHLNKFYFTILKIIYFIFLRNIWPYSPAEASYETKLAITGFVLLCRMPLPTLTGGLHFLRLYPVRNYSAGRRKSHKMDVGTVGNHTLSYTHTN